MAEKPNKGWIKELGKKPTPAKPKDTFNYNKPVSKVDKINSMAINSRSREYKSVSQDKSTSFTIEQNKAKASHKGDK